MGKKNQKQQPKQANAANIGTTTATNQPASTPHIDVHALATTQHSFFDFITLATVEDVKKFLTLASTTSEGKNLECLWRRAYEEGCEKGRKSLLRNLERKLEEKFEEGVERGMNLGREEGYTVAKEAFDDIIKTVKAREVLKVNTTDTSSQTGTSATTTASISIQTGPHVIHTPFMASSSTQTEATMSQHLTTSLPTCIASSQSSSPCQNSKNAKIHCTSEMSPNITIFSSQTPSATVLDPLEPSTSTTALKTRSETTDSVEKHQKLESPPILTQKPPKALSINSVGHLDDVDQARTSPQTPNNTISHPSTLPPTASSSLTPYLTEHQKNEPLSAIFKSEPPTESLASTTIATASKTRSVSTNSTENYKKVEKSHIFNQNHPEPPDFKSKSSLGPPARSYVATCLKSCSASPDVTENCQNFENLPIFTQNLPETSKTPVSDRFIWADDVESPAMTHTTPTKYPRDLSGLRSSMTNPFSSLRRRCRNNKKSRRFINPWPQFCCHHKFQKPPFFSPSPHMPHHPPEPHRGVPVSLDWDQDPRLADLSNALQALGWVRR
jgi:hypothetical protein